VATEVESTVSEQLKTSLRDKGKKLKKKLQKIQKLKKEVVEVEEEQAVSFNAESGEIVVSSAQVCVVEAECFDAGVAPFIASDVLENAFCFDEVEEFDGAVPVSFGTGRLSDSVGELRATVGKRPRVLREGFAVRPPVTVEGFRGDVIVVECEVYNESETVRWMLDGKPCDSDDRCTAIENGYLRYLELRDVVPSDTNKVICAVLKTDSADTTLLIEDVETEIVDKLPWKLTGLLDESVELVVELSRPADNVKWYFNNNEIMESDRIQVCSTGSTCSLRILNPTYDDAGRYSVVADGAESSTVVDIQGKPILKDEEIVKFIDVECHENLIINLPFSASPEPSVSCFFNGKLVTEKAKIQMNVFGNVAQFCKRKVEKCDSGEYTLKISNEFGENTCTFEVKVRDAPKAPADFVVSEINANTVVLKWSKPNDDGGSPITGYVVEKKEINRRTFHRAAQVSESTDTLTVEGLESDKTYSFRIAAINKFGTGEYIDIPEVTTISKFSKPVVEKAPHLEVTEEGCLLTWDKVEKCGGSPIYNYDVYMKINDEGWTKINQELVFSEQYKVTNLTPDATYVFKVEATNEAGLTSDSNVVSESLTISAPLVKPVPKLNIPRITITGPDSVSVDWDEPEVDFENVVSYTVQFKSETSPYWSKVDGDEPPITIQNLKDGVSYIFKIAAVGSNGVGDFSEETQPVKIITESKPEITKGIRKTIVPRKRELRLECHAKGEPAPQYIWYRNDEEIIPDENIEVKEFDFSMICFTILTDGYASILSIPKTTANDEGIYCCKVQNRLGFEETKAEVIISEVRGHFVQSFAPFTEIAEGSDYRFVCEVSDEDTEVKWTKNGVVIEESNRCKIEKDHLTRALTLSNVSTADSAEYACVTIDGRSKMEGELFVIEEEPRILQGPFDQTILDYGTSVTLECKLTKPAKNVRWFKNDKEIWHQEQKFLVCFEDCTSVLKIISFGPSDVGQYYAYISETEKSVKAFINLKIPPHLSVELDNNEGLTVKAGNDINCQFKFVGYPTPKLRFLLNKKEVEKFRSRINIDEENGSICIKKSRKEDKGVLRIEATNENGEDSREINIKVIDVPLAPTHLISSDVTECSTTLEWRRPESDNGCPLTLYVIERRMADTTRWRHVKTVEPNCTQTTIEDLIPDQLYAFRIIAFNEVGESPASKTCEVTTLFAAIEPAENEVELKRPNPPIFVFGENGIVNISWDEVTNADSYVIEKSATNDLEWTTICETNQLVCVDSELKKGDEVVYRVTARNGDVSSLPSSDSVVVRITSTDDDSGALQTDAEEGENRDSEVFESVTQEETSITASLEIFSKNGTKEQAEFEEKVQLMKTAKNIKKKTSNKKKRTSAAGAELDSTIEKNLSKLRITAKDTTPCFECGKDEQLKVNIESSFDKCFWTKDGNTIEDENVLTTANCSVLKLINVSELTKGKYICTALNSASKSVVEFDVTVFEKPSIEFEENSIDVRDSEPVKIYAFLRGIPKPEIFWEKDGVKLVPKENVVISKKDDVASLIIKKSDSNDSGIYTLRAENTAGKCESDIKVIIKGVPSIPSGPLEVNNVTSNSCMLSWNAPSSDGNSKLLGYCIEKREAKKSSWAFIARTSQTTAEITGMIPGSVYYFRVSAENAFGCGANLETKDAVKFKKPDTSSLILSKPTAKKIDEDSITVEWKCSTNQQLKYNIEIKQSDSKNAWTLVNKKPTSKNCVTAKSLKQGVGYMFRVHAVSEDGPKQISEVSDVFKCLVKEAADHIEVSNYSSVSEPSKLAFINAPDNVIGIEDKKVKIIAEFVGKLPVEAKWFRNSKEIFSGKRQWIETTENSTKLTIGEMHEDDEGEMKVVLSNAAETVDHKFALIFKSPATIAKPERYSAAELYNRGENVKLRLTFAGK
uniref:Immunoglobulin domain protein n=1 Tax=Syphacia muris TaxID=451379 RepID=A0A0N5ALN8_9BILA